uniref:Uncharacterized protein n=1 Tax=Strombidium rassoulzadegani TaxID=1082188 RepID=A0A7S3CSS7_9SPIT|mmetsp:Transcript_7004/g.11764  ORF Transcript_7004/g.11764 Transcript_7004/m.11764 type:complete len:176 (+) Transcript_7004:1247-1774(+)
MSLSLFSFALFLHFRVSSLSIASMLSQTLFFQLFFAPVHWIYLPEILSDAQFGFVCMINYLNGVEFTLATEYFIKFLTLEGTFLLHASITLTGVFFMIFVVKETEGLSDREKKQLYKGHGAQNGPSIEAIFQSVFQSQWGEVVEEGEGKGVEMQEQTHETEQQTQRLDSTHRSEI